MNQITSSFAADYARDGFVFPVDILSADGAAALRADLEGGEDAVREDRQKLGLLRGYPARLLPSFDRLIRHPKMVAAASAVLGPDVMVWGSGLFIKEANTPSYVSWHQDLTYWGLDKVDEVTFVGRAVAVDDGKRLYALRRRQPPAEHRAAQGQLRRRQSADARPGDQRRGRRGRGGRRRAAAGPGIGPSRPPLPRFRPQPDGRPADIGAAIRYIAPSMRSRSGPETEVALVAGEDRFGHFRIVPPPSEPSGSGRLRGGRGRFRAAGKCSVRRGGGKAPPAIAPASPGGTPRLGAARRWLACPRRADRNTPMASMRAGPRWCCIDVEPDSSRTQWISTFRTRRRSSPGRAPASAWASPAAWRGKARASRSRHGAKPRCGRSPTRWRRWAPSR